MPRRGSLPSRLGGPPLAPLRGWCQWVISDPAYFTGFYGEGVIPHDSADQVISFTRLVALAWTDSNPQALEHVSVNPFHTIYLHCDLSPGTGEDSVRPRGNSSILPSIPVTSPYGSMVHDNSLNAKCLRNKTQSARANSPMTIHHGTPYNRRRNKRLRKIPNRLAPTHRRHASVHLANFGNQKLVRKGRTTAANDVHRRCSGPTTPCSTWHALPPAAPECYPNGTTEANYHD